jgi:hypothetical protein
MQKVKVPKDTRSIREKAVGELSRDGPKTISSGWPTQPILALFAAPFDLVPPWAIYSPHVKIHVEYHSSFTAEEYIS